MKMLTIPKEQRSVTKSTAEANWLWEQYFLRKGIYSIYLIKAWILNYAKYLLHQNAIKNSHQNQLAYLSPTC